MSVSCDCFSNVCKRSFNFLTSNNQKYNHDQLEATIIKFEKNTNPSNTQGILSLVEIETHRIRSIISEIDVICDEYKTIDRLGYDYVDHQQYNNLPNEDIPKYAQIIRKYGCKYNSQDIDLPQDLRQLRDRTKHLMSRPQRNADKTPKSVYSEILPKIAKMLVENVENIVVFYDTIPRVLIDYFVLACELYAVNPTMSRHHYEDRIYLCYVNIKREYKINSIMLKT